jgi:hypothetical protein
MRGDRFIFRTIKVQKPRTKRGILSVISSIFNPQSPYIIRAKIILQVLWEKGADWDEILAEESLEEWSKWLIDLDQLPHDNIT